MYRVTVLTDGKEYVLHDVFSREQIMNDEWGEFVGKTSTFKFSIDPEHINYSKIQPLASEIKIYKDGRTCFWGRPITPKKDTYSCCEVECVGGLSYLADSIQRPFTHTGPMQEFIAQLLLVHNGMVEGRKKLSLGIVNVPGGECTRTVDGLTDTLTVLNEYLVAEYGGYLHVREEDGVRYLDYVTDYGGYNSQIIRFGENLLDLSSQIDASEIITCLIPEGASKEVENADGTVSDETVKISAVNDGKDYIQNQKAIEKWGMVWGSVVFDDVTDPEELLILSERYLEKKVSLPEKFELTAFDLSLVDATIDELKVGCWTEFISPPHGIKATYLLQGIKRHLTAPHKDRVVFGGERETMSGATASIGHSVAVQINRVKQSASREIDRKVTNATQLITGGLGGYVIIGRAEDGHPEEILIMDTPDRDKAKNIIRLNKNGLGFSNEGYTGPYNNAWTIDGNLIADFITTGTMHADRIRGGTLEVGGTSTGKDGVILIKDSDGKVIGRLDKNGIQISNGTVSGSSISGGSIEVGVLMADDSSAWLGDWYVSADGSNIFASSDGSVSFQTAIGGPFGQYAVLKLTSESGTTIVSDHHVETAAMWAKTMIQTPSVHGYDEDDQRYSYFYDIKLGRSWWGGDSITDTVRELWESCDGVSDERAKKNIESIDAAEAVEFLLNARPVTFQYKRDGKWSAGFIAQEVDAAMDEMEIYFPIVGTDQRTGLYKLDYRTYIPLLVKAYQALYAEVQDLRDIVKDESKE